MAYNQGKNPFSKNPLNFNSPLNSFDSLVGKLMNQGKSKEAATKIAGKVANAKLKGAGKGPTAAQKARMKSSPAKQAKPDFLDLDKDGNTTEPMKEAAKGSPANLKEKSPAELKSPVDKKLVGKQKNLPEGLKKAIEAAPESPAKMKSPMKKHGDKFRKRAMKLSEKAEQGDYDYDNPKVVELLNKAKEADKKHEGSPAKKEKPHGTYADQGLIKSYKKGDKYIAIDGSSHDDAISERRASAKALTKAKAKARANRGKSSPAKMKSPMKKDGERADLLSRGGKIVKKGAKKFIDTHPLNPKNITKGRKAINKGIKKASKKVKKLTEGVVEFAKDTQKRAT